MWSRGLCQGSAELISSFNLLSDGILVLLVWWGVGKEVALKGGGRGVGWCVEWEGVEEWDGAWSGRG